jgi:hypothetical protein
MNLALAAAITEMAPELVAAPAASVVGLWSLVRCVEPGVAIATEEGTNR